MSTSSEIIVPIESGMLDVGDGDLVYWEQCGEGSAVVTVHGGPGSGLTMGVPPLLDPERFRTIRYDQRNCGLSTPHASDPTVDLSANTTQNLVADLEKLREHLGIDTWVLRGGSWGSTLILAYAEAHPERVKGIVISAVTMTRRSEVAWLYEGVGRFFPEAHERFRTFIPEADRGEDVFDLLAAYGRQMRHPDPEVREATAKAWLDWEDAVISQEVHGTPGVYNDRPDDAKIAFVRICAHYFSQGAFLEEGQLLAGASRLAGIPGVLTHGRLDMGGPPITAWELAKAWPDAELLIVDDMGHTGKAGMRERFQEVMERFAAVSY